MKGKTATGGFLGDNDPLHLLGTALEDSPVGAQQTPEDIHRGGITAADLKIASGCSEGAGNRHQKGLAGNEAKT